MFPLFHLDKQNFIFLFLTVIGVKCVDITFSFMKGDKLVIGAQLVSMIMNLGKGDSVSLSEDPDLFYIRLNFVGEKSYLLFIFH